MGAEVKKAVMLGFSFFFVCVFVSFLTQILLHLPPVGVHHRCFLQTELEGRTVKVQRTHGRAASQQPDGQQDLDPRHLLPQWQEVGGSQHDDAEQAAANHRGRHAAVHHEVGCASRTGASPN